MAKKKEYIFYCKSCGNEATKWSGQCPVCKEWNTMEEMKTEGLSKRAVTSARTGELREPVSFSDIELGDEDRISIGMPELDRVLGGGIVPGSLILVGGDPGIGKSTLLLQVCKLLSDKGIQVLYISGEESPRQIKLRAVRIGNMDNCLKLYCETCLEDICDIIRKTKPKVVVVDSIQTMYSENVDSTPGSVTQVREATGKLMKLAKEEGITIFVVGHVTKEGTVAGPRMLEHMVDLVLYFEGDRHASYRILRGVKNRFGSTNEIGVFEMKAEGLREVANPSEYMLQGRPENGSGSVVSCALEGTRPLLVEIQALVTRTNFGFPRRQASGTDLNRLNLLMAVLEKRGEIRLSEYDAYVNLVGGIKINEPAIDLALALAIISSFRNRPIPAGTAAFGEIGLGGEIRAVSNPLQRIKEAVKLGFDRCILPKTCLKGIDKVEGIELCGVATVNEALEYVD